jgi:diguanylate cyclase (GGDEF)-like protein/PAS domain S-box-containing protein
MADPVLPMEFAGAAPVAGAGSVLDGNLFASFLDACPDGVVICDVRGNDNPVVYVNRAFEQLCGYRAAELIGKNMRLLHGDDRDQEGLSRIRLALKEGVAAQTTLRNYRKDGTLFWNELRIVPMHNAARQITHFVTFHREVGERLRPDVRIPEQQQKTEPRDPALNTQTMLAYLRDDKLTGLLRRGYFDELLKRDVGVAKREKHAISLFIFDPDYFEPYRELFGRPGADQTLRRVGRTIGACFRRASDLCGRFDDTRIVSVCTGMDVDHATRHAESVLARVRDLAIHHPRSAVSRFLTMSAGVATFAPDQDITPEKLIAAAQDALQKAREEGRNRAVSV